MTASLSVHCVYLMNTFSTFFGFCVENQESDQQKLLSQDRENRESWLLEQTTGRSFGMKVWDLHFIQT